MARQSKSKKKESTVLASCSTILDLFHKFFGVTIAGQELTEKVVIEEEKRKLEKKYANRTNKKTKKA